MEGFYECLEECNKLRFPFTGIITKVDPKDGEFKELFLKLLLENETENESDKLKIIRNLIKNYIAIYDLEKKLVSVSHFKKFSKYGSRYMDDFIEEELEEIKKIIVDVIKSTFNEIKIGSDLKRRFIDNDKDEF